MSEAEKDFIRLVMLDDTVLDRVSIQPNDLGNAVNKTILNEIIKIVSEGLKVDSVLLVNRLRDIIPFQEITELSSRAINQFNWKFYSDKLIREIKLRKLQSIPSVITDMLNSGKDPDDITAILTEKIDNVQVSFNEYAIQTEESLVNHLDIIQSRVGADRFAGRVKCGIPFIDDVIGGFPKESFTVIGGRPSDGKSALWQNMFYASAMHGVKPGAITCESSLEECLDRSISIGSHVEHKRITEGNLTPSSFAFISEAADKMYNTGFCIYDEPNAEIDRVKSVVRRMVNVHKINILYVDYIQIIKAMNKRAQRYEQVGEVSMALKSLARELKIPIVAAAQLRRPKESHKKPELSDFKESGQIEQDADIAILIQHKKDTETGFMKSWLHIEKGRNIGKGSIAVYFNGDFVKFEERISDQTESEPF